MRNSIGISDDSYDQFIAYFKSTNFRVRADEELQPLGDRCAHSPSGPARPSPARHPWIAGTRSPSSLAQGKRRFPARGRHIDFVEGKNATAVAQVISDWLS